jgi:DNA repair exonuclease SbcCD ATPase subunit
MRILKLKLDNFQGVRAADYQFDGKNASFYGENGSGKTTLLNAYTWLLFGKASDGAANFTPKPRKGDEDVHNVDTSVEMTFTHNKAEHTLLRMSTKRYPR